MKLKPVPQHVRMAREIEREQDANTITALLQRHQVEIEGTDVRFVATQKGLSWTVETIASYSGIADIERVDRALLMLVSKQWVQRRGRGFFITLFGVSEYQNGLKSSHIDTCAAALKFKNIVLTGSKEEKTERGYTTLKPAGIENPALNKGSHYEGHRNLVEEEQLKRCSSVQYIHSIALDNNCTDMEAIEKLQTGAIHKCNICGRQKEHHAHGGKTRWQSGCITCRKAKP